MTTRRRFLGALGLGGTTAIVAGASSRSSGALVANPQCLAAHRAEARCSRCGARDVPVEERTAPCRCTVMLCEPCRGRPEAGPDCLTGDGWVFAMGESHSDSVERGRAYGFDDCSGCSRCVCQGSADGIVRSGRLRAARGDAGWEFTIQFPPGHAPKALHGARPPRRVNRQQRWGQLWATGIEGRRWWYEFKSRSWTVMISADQERKRKRKSA